MHALATGRRNVYEKLIGGVLGGLVAITASCDVATPIAAMLIGATAGMVHNWAFERLSAWRIDDVAGAIPVHGACGVWGTFCTGFVMWWGQPGGNPTQVLVQVLGILAALVYAGGVSCAIFWTVERVVGLRVSTIEEDGGRADPMLGEYEGGLRVSVVRTLGFWSRFMPFHAYMRLVQRSTPVPRQAKNDVISALRTEKSRFIRDDDTEATEDDVKGAVDAYFG